MSLSTLLCLLIIVRWVYVEIMYREAVKAIEDLTDWTNRNQRRMGR